MKRKLKRYKAFKGSWYDCNRNPYEYWNIIDRVEDRVIAQAYKQEDSDLILKKLNGR